MLILRDMLPSDIEDYVRWFTEETEWSNWDAPWEPLEDSPEQVRKDWTARCRSLMAQPADRLRCRFELEADGVHIGWVSAYTDLGELKNPQNIPAIGIDIPEKQHRRRGYGKAALRQFIHYYKERGYRQLFTQTWSGNLPMIALAESLGFIEISRIKGIREVGGKRYDALTFCLDL